ncbi:MAG: site-specific integrase [Pseudomonadota bacterium]
MAEKAGNFSALMSLYSNDGDRKYLTQSERARFYAALDTLGDTKARTFAETIYWTGCRPCEALHLSPLQVDVDENVIIFRSAKKRGALKGRHYRPVPVPHSFMLRLDRIHNLQATRSHRSNGSDTRLWTFSRSTGWLLIRGVMQAAKLSGVKACARGLRHTYGVHAVLSGVPLPRIQFWMAHASMETTAVYLQLAGAEDREIASRMWRETMAA